MHCKIKLSALRENWKKDIHTINVIIPVLCQSVTSRDSQESHLTMGVIDCKQHTYLGTMSLRWEVAVMSEHSFNHYQILDIPDIEWWATTT